MRNPPAPRSVIRRSRRRRTAAAVTIKEVARRAGVSVATVSRVVNDAAPVREETRRRIRHAIHRLRYVPHGAAKSLITRKTHTLAVLLPDLYGEFFSELIRGIDLAARRGGYHLLVSGSHGSPAEMEAMLRAIRGRVDGLIALAPDLPTRAFDENLPPGFPVVLLNGGGRRGSSIRVDNSGGARSMVRHLIGLGHRAITFVTGPPSNHDAAERRRGFRDAIRRKPATSAREVPGDFREEAGYRAASRILKARPRSTAVFAANDAMAIGVLCAFQERGIQVPEEIAVVGFDDIPTSRFITPALTTVRVPIAELGARATARLLHALRGSGGSPGRPETLRTTLVVRASCGCPQGRAPAPSLPVPARARDRLQSRGDPDDAASGILIDSIRNPDRGGKQ
jgi:LacI family transcriptional regulator